MKLRRCSVNMLKRMSKKKKLLCFGAGQNLYNFFSSHKEEKLEERIAFILDNSIAKNGEYFKINGVDIEIKLPDVLKELRLSEYIILITAGKYAEIFAQIQNLCNNANIDVYMLPIRRSIFWYWIEFMITKLPIKNYILIRGEGDTCENTKAFGAYIKNNNFFDKYIIIWLCNNSSLFENTKKEKYININTLLYSKSIIEVFRYCWYYGRAKYLIYENQHLKKMRDEQIMVYLNHGAPPIKATKGIINLPASLNYAVSPSEFSSKIICDQYSINKERVIICGSPRTDIFYERKTHRTILGLDFEKYKKVILWTPTFRQLKNTVRIDSDLQYLYGVPILKKEIDFNVLCKTLEKENILLLIKPHQLQNLSYYKIQSTKNVKLLLQEELNRVGISFYSLICQVDALITDYSTIAFDFMLLDRPLAYTLDDLENYTIGFSVDNIKSLMPGHYIYTLEDLNTFIKSVSNGEDKYGEKRNQVKKIIHTYTDGENSKRLCEILGIRREKGYDN